jgi:hypothetical protein
MYLCRYIRYFIEKTTKKYLCSQMFTPIRAFLIFKLISDPLIRLVLLEDFY